MLLHLRHQGSVAHNPKQITEMSNRLPCMTSSSSCASDRVATLLLHGHMLEFCSATYHGTLLMALPLPLLPAAALIALIRCHCCCCLLPMLHLQRNCGLPPPAAGTSAPLPTEGPRGRHPHTIASANDQRRLQLHIDQTPAPVLSTEPCCMLFR